MIQKYILLSIFFIQSVFMAAQVGINNQNPEATLDVSGDVRVREKLFLQDPGIYTSASNSELLMIKDSNNEIIKYNIVDSEYGPLNYVQFVFENTSDNGLKDGYNTKINATKYTLAVHGFSFKETVTNNTSISFRSTVGSNTDRFMEGHQFYAYVQGGTWWIKGFANNSRFYQGVNPTKVDIYMNIIIYRNNFITKIWENTQVIDMDKKETKILELLPGF